MIQLAERPPESERVRIFITSLNDECFTLMWAPSETVEELKHLFAEKNGLPPDQARFLYAGKKLEDC